MNTDVDVRSRVRAIVASIDGGRIRLRLPHTDYQLDLVLAAAAGSVTTPVGKRIRGTIEARAMRLHAVAGGGRSIEPVIGEPRIITATVLAIDPDERRALVDAAAPMWLDLKDDQDLDVFRAGGLVTGYVESGAVFTPDAG